MMRATVFVRMVLAIAAVAAVANANRALAEVIFHEDNIATDENLQFNDGLGRGPAATIQGLTNTSNTLVDISRIDPDPIELVAPSAGAARVSAEDGGVGALFSGATFETVGKFFTAFEFNVQVDDDGILTILAVDSNGNAYSSALQAGFNGAVGNGENRFGVTSGGGTLLKSVTVLLDGQIVEDIRQIRFGGITSVPEPTSVALGFLSLVGFGLFARTRFARRGA